ncbi:pyruvate dehydrogenase E1 component, beta subunit [Mycoplasmopsis californica]|uniref:Alpha-ketoacid dehydrogenase subunit beta n=1 Tax=Mycoplasmopsis equigenitalium TaxID=114883 RepID=A0ABY5J3B6_9BACT|nr:alpha-ketoacid dehydrogenase subunit beta [Mycoplasmopsis equigenitalium]UUD37224.1 alpha-ketoacid dehydrogenase subunit beta [Mycoplasmopsis equigenitalium]VEU69470.1 pyruvate dehydrogenase E1 component, beta subunit [Mycoplasmopsis californica]
MANITLNNIGAITHALELAMKKDKRVVSYGQDAGFEGGVFRATEGLQAKFGVTRSWDAPISEASIAGVAVGAAVAGLRPVAEIQFSGFSYPAMQQIFTHAARMRNRSRGRFHCPLVMRIPMSGGIRALEHHSEALEAIYAHVPGVKVVLPAFPYDTKGLLLAAIEDNDPVIFFEPKKIYRSGKQEIPEEYYTVEIGKANVLAQGDSITLVTYGVQVHDSIQAIQQLKATNPEISVELIDLRTIKPLDYKTVIESVKKTGRLLVVHEAVKSFSVSAEIMAQVNEKAFEYLKAPLARLTGYDVTVPLAKGEGFHAINADKIVAKIKEVVGFQF